MLDKAAREAKGTPKTLIYRHNCLRMKAAVIFPESFPKVRGERTGQFKQRY